MRAIAVLWAFGAGLLALSSSLSPAHEGAAAVVKQRMDEMEKIGRTVKRINERLKSKRGLGEIGHDAEEIRTAAARMPPLFPEGSRDGHTEATAAVWDRQPEFIAAARVLEHEAEKLAAAVRSGTDGAVAAQFRSLTRACSGCRDIFRSKR